MKRQISYWDAFLSTLRVKSMKQEEVHSLQRARMERLFLYARQNSKFYSEKYMNLPKNPPIERIPTVNKRELMANFNDWVTDSNLNIEDLKEYISSQENIGRPYLNQYLVATTSGSTGLPAVVLLDNNSQAVIDALAVTRSIAYKGTMWKLIKSGGRSAAIYATTGHYFGVASVRNKQIRNPLKAKQFSVLSVQMPIKDIVEKLNTFNPALLGGYPTALELLIPEKISGRLQIKPVLINTGGEYLSKELAEKLSEVFECNVQSGYSCTEGGLIAFQCSAGHLHVNEDWVIIEPVDRYGNAVPKGTLSDKIYLTNLTNFVQPIIRYEVSDRIRICESQCPCGSSLMAIEVEGRTDDILEFEDGNVKILPLSIYVVLKEIPGVVRFQVIQKSDEMVELRLETIGDRSRVCNRTIEILNSFFLEHGVSPRIHLSESLPTTESSGKFKHVSKMTQ